MKETRICLRYEFLCMLYNPMCEYCPFYWKFELYEPVIDAFGELNEQGMPLLPKIARFVCILFARHIALFTCANAYSWHVIGQHVVQMHP